MITNWNNHKFYQSFITEEINSFMKTQPMRIVGFKNTIAKLTSLNLDPVFEILKPYYSKIGRPAKAQAEILRSLILMIEQKETSITSWCKKLKSDNLLAVLIGCIPENLPPLGSYYDFIDRLWLRSKSIDKKNRKKLYTFNRKPSKNIGKNNKLPNKNLGVVRKVKDFFLSGRSLNKRPERLLQEIFSLVAVIPSLELGLINETDLTISGDGTCVHCHSSSYGIKVCDCRKNGIYDCKCKRRFSDPDALFGWDSYLGQWFYGHTLYALSTYNKKLKIDLPLYLRFVGANRHDSVTGIFALAEFRNILPNLKIHNLCFDSANDNYPTYELLKEWDIRPFIDLNGDVGRKATYPPALRITNKGVPICLENQEMVYHGFCKNRSRIKWRCPLAMGKITYCSCKDSCSPSPYGRVIYTKPNWDLRLFTPVPRGSKEFKAIFNSRTCSERINNRILNDYNLHSARIQGKKRFSIFTMLIGINIHLDARVKCCASLKL